MIRAVLQDVTVLVISLALVIGNIYVFLERGSIPAELATPLGLCMGYLFRGQIENPAGFLKNTTNYKGLMR